MNFPIYIFLTNIYTYVSVCVCICILLLLLCIVLSKFSLVSLLRLFDYNFTAYLLSYRIW